MPSKAPRPQRPLAPGHTRVSFAVSSADWEQVGTNLTWGQRSLLMRRLLNAALKHSPNVIQAFLRGELEIKFTNGRQV